MLYSFRCDPCDSIFDIRMSLAEHDAGNQKCPDCSGDVWQYMGTAPVVHLPASMTYNGQLKVIDGKPARKEPSRVPINIIDEKPDGSCRVTRLGRKQDIDND